MSFVVIAKCPDFSFLVTAKGDDQIKQCSLPIILKKGGRFDWDANSYITEYGGGAQVYNIKPLASTVVKKAYSVNLFCSFLEEINILTQEVDDSTLYKFIAYLKNRLINDSTIISHGRAALDYILFLSKKHPELNLCTSETKSNKNYKIHYNIKTFKQNGFDKKYLHHSSFNGLIHISVEAEYIRDHDLVKWLDAINCTSYHPETDEFLVSRWQALTTILEITGSRITEASSISRTMIKDASRSLLDHSKKPIIRNIPILKGKYKGKNRHVEVTIEDLQIIFWHITVMEKRFPNLKHDSLFVNSKIGIPLKPSYIKNYTKKVINGSKYLYELRHLTNHSFRHRFITLTIAKAIKKLSEFGSFNNILNIAMTACRKTSMHASNNSLSHYVHLACELNEYDQNNDQDLSQIPTSVRIRLKHMMTIAHKYTSKEIDNSEALSDLLSTINDLRIILFEKYKT